MTASPRRATPKRLGSRTARETPSGSSSPSGSRPAKPPEDAPLAFAVDLEIGPRRRVFAWASDWPGWCRSGGDEAAALSALAAYAARYQSVAIAADLPFQAPASADAFEVRERIDGSPVTDFGGLARLSSDDRRPFTTGDVDHLQRFLSACWASFDAVYRRIPAMVRSRKPGVGRSPAAMRFHLLDTDLMHRSAFGPAYRKPAPDDVDRLEPVVRGEILAALTSVPLGIRAESTRRYGFEWTPRFAVRRAAWHALDHAWQLEDSLKRSR